MSLPQFDTRDLTLSLMQSAWAKEIDPVLKLPTNSGQVLKSVSLGVGVTQVNHKLSRALQGWYLVRKRGPAAIYDLQDANSMPTLTLTLVSDAAVVVDIFVY